MGSTPSDYIYYASLQIETIGSTTITTTRQRSTLLLPFIAPWENQRKGDGLTLRKIDKLDKRMKLYCKSSSEDRLSSLVNVIANLLANSQQSALSSEGSPTTERFRCWDECDSRCDSHDLNGVRFGKPRAPETYCSIRETGSPELEIHNELKLSGDIIEILGGGPHGRETKVSHMMQWCPDGLTF
ncbi:hypothetical protein JTB14_004244 [Gonioctena quinquepunctata]|nr:hypothetical protein JTB14_004244 [Gonioctena quinquepunctata]